jgi:hypothetical protein
VAADRPETGAGGVEILAVMAEAGPVEASFPPGSAPEIEKRKRVSRQREG